MFNAFFYIVHASNQLIQQVDTDKLKCHPHNKWIVITEFVLYIIGLSMDFFIISLVLFEFFIVAIIVRREKGMTVE